MEYVSTEQKDLSLSRSLNFSFLLVLVVNAVFFSGYIIFKDPLSYILYSEGIPLKAAYSITTTANILLSVISLFFGFFMSNCGRQKHSLLLSIVLCTIAISLLSTSNYYLTVTGISLYVLGGGLYFFNIALFVNKFFYENHERIKGNYAYQIFTNIGAAVGMLLLLTQLNSDHVFRISFILCLSSLVMMLFAYNKIEDEKEISPNYPKFYAYIISVYFVICIALHFEMITRMAVIGLFVTSVMYGIYSSLKNKHYKFLLIIGLVLLINLPYWVANTIFFNEFFYFLRKDVTPILGLSPSYLALTDPFVNIFFGLIIYQWQSEKKNISSYRNLQLGSFLLLTAALFLAFGLFMDKLGSKINFFYPMFSLVLFACSEFLMLSTLNATIRNLLPRDKKKEFFSTGIMRGTRAFATVIGFYLISATVKTKENIANDIQTNFYLFSSLVGICIVSFSCLMILKKYILIAERD